MTYLTYSMLTGSRSLRAQDCRREGCGGEGVLNNHVGPQHALPAGKLDLSVTYEQRVQTCSRLTGGLSQNHLELKIADVKAVGEKACSTTMSVLSMLCSLVSLTCLCTANELQRLDRTVNSTWLSRTPAT